MTGDTGADEEGLRAQRQLYSSDRSYLVQQQVWQALAAGQPIDAILASAADGHSSSSSASSAGSDWTSVSGVNSGESADYYTKGGSKFADRYTAAGGYFRSPSSALRESSSSIQNSQKSSTSSSSSASSAASSSSSVSGTSGYVAPVTKTVETVSSRYVQPSAYTSTVYHTKSAPLVQQNSHSYWYNSPYTSYQTLVHPQPARLVTKTVHTHQPVQTARLVQTTTKTVPLVSARIVETSKTVQPTSYHTTTLHTSPAAKLVEISKQGSSSSSSTSSSSSASASSSASSSSSSSSGAYTSGGIKGGYHYGAIKSAPIRTGRYVVVPTGGRTVVNFSQGGPQPYKYSYAFK